MDEQIERVARVIDPWAWNEIDDHPTVGKRRAESLETAQAAIAAMDEWEPIESAPFSGPPVLLFRDGEMFTAMRVTGASGPGWCTYDGFEIFRPTHWQPLPKPPGE